MGRAGVSGWRRAILAATALCLVAPRAAQAHLVSTDLGPFYDGALHALMTPLDVLTVLAIAAIAGLGGAAEGRSALLALGAARY